MVRETLYSNDWKRRLVANYEPGCATYLGLILWLNLYICRQAFFIEFTGKMNSMHGFWIAMANLSGGHWWKPGWWPYWYNGIPFEYTYAPLVPGLARAIALVSGVSAARGFQIVSGSVYCLGPVALFLMARQLTRRAGWSFIAAVVYSLSSASELLLPDSAFSLRNVAESRRLYVNFVWDETPHQLGLALICLGILFLARALEDHRYGSYFRAGLFISLSLLASAFGATDFLLFAGCLLITRKISAWQRDFAGVFVCGFVAWLAVCPFLPPSLIWTIRSNAALFPNMAWTGGSWVALTVVAGGVWLLWFCSRTWQSGYRRFFLLLAWTTFAIPALDAMRGLHFLPQAGRYKVELEAALVPLIVFTAAIAIDRLPKIARVALAVLLLWPTYNQIVRNRRFSRDAIQPVDVTRSIEYKVAKWTGTNLPGWRVVAPGSIGFWLNTFSRTPQFTGGAFTTAPNRVQLRASWELKSDPDSVIPAIWYKAYGVDAVVVAGRDSREFWKPYEPGRQFEGSFPLLWEERDTRIFAVPRPARTLVHAISRSAVVSDAPARLSDTKQLERYVAGVEGAPPATFEWLEDSRARIHAVVRAGEVLSVQTTWNSGWKASDGGRSIPIAQDGLGQMILSPARPGEYNIDLVYDGGWEGSICRAVSGTVLLVTVAALWFRRRERGSGPRPQDV